MEEHHSYPVPYELERLEQSRVAVAAHRHEPLPVQGPVAAGTGAEPTALELLLARDAELAEPRARGDDDGRGADVAVVGDEAPVVAPWLEAPHLAHRERAAGVHHLLLHPRRELEAGDALREPREILDPLRVQDRPAHAERVQQHRAAAVPRREERGGEPGRPTPRHCDLVVHRHALAQPTSAHPGGATPGKSSTSSSISAIAVDTRPQR